MRRIISKILLMAGLTAALSSCNGIMGGLYDEPQNEETPTYGFLKKSDGTHAGRIYVDATKYDRWVYIDFHTGKVDSCLVADSLHRPANWDIALHRYDVKTHGGSVLKTQYSELFDLTSTGTMPAGNFANDVWSTHKVMIDVSHMMQGHVVFESTWYNAALDWVTVDTSTMPPTFSTSGKVYIIRMADGTCAAVRLVSYMNVMGTKGHMTFDYIYPLTLQ